MKSKVFHLVTFNDGKSDSAAIVKVFSEIAAGRLKCDLKLLNYCGEMPVSYGSAITSVGKDSVELLIHEHQSMIINHDKYTLIKSEHFHNELGVHCSVSNVNVPNNTVVLHNFAYAQIRSEKREAIRVKVNGALPVRFFYENVNIEGSMVDISGNSISINFNRFPAMKADQSGQLFFTLSGTQLAVPGLFVKSSTNGSDGHICIFHIKPDKMTDSTISRFICLRQVEVIQQLKYFFIE